MFLFDSQIRIQCFLLLMILPGKYNCFIQVIVHSASSWIYIFQMHLSLHWFKTASQRNWCKRIFCTNIHPDCVCVHISPRSSPRGLYIILVYIIFCECSETLKLVYNIIVCTTLSKTYVCMYMYFVPCTQLLLYECIIW